MAEPSLSLSVLPDVFAVCRLASDAPMPAWATGDLVSITRTAEELSIVCAQHQVPEAVQCERGWRCLKVAGPLAFSLIGVLAALAAPLAQAGVSLFAISAYDTDYLLVRETDLERAIQALSRAGHHIEPG